LGKLPITVRDSDNCQANISVTWVITWDWCSSRWSHKAKATVLGTDNNSVKTVMVSTSPEESAVDKMEKW